MSEKSRIFAIEKGTKNNIYLDGEQRYLNTHSVMTQNQKFYVEQIINYLNLLADDRIFTQEWSHPFGDEHYNEVTIKAKNSAYLKELHQLVDLLDMMHPLHDEQEPQTTIR